MNDVTSMTAAVAANPFDETAQLVLADAIAEGTGNYADAVKKAKRVALEARIAVLVAHVDELSRENWEKHHFMYAPHPVHRADYISAKWCRVVVIDRTHEGGERVGRVFAFVCLADGHTKSLGNLKAGDIHKPHGFKAPAKHARGNVFDPDFGKSLTVHGPNYLR